MKLSKLTALLLVAATAFSVTALTSCKKQTSDSENPVKNNTFVPDLVISGKASDYDPDAPHGEKRLYGKAFSNYLIDSDIYFLRIGCLTYASVEDPLKMRVLCFDPLCSHQKDESCAATINDNNQYNREIFLDSYDHADSPVLYLYYRRANVYMINGETKTRDSVSCIERLDLTTGKRTVVLDGMKETILDVMTYGDYAYFIHSDPECEQAIGRVHKSGGETAVLKNKGISSYKIIQALNDKLYFVANNQYLYCCDLDLTNVQCLRDLAEIKGSESTNGLIAGAYGSYLYYIADVKNVLDGTKVNGQKGNCYRVPLDAPNAEPELIVEGMACMYKDLYCFTEDILYYQPAVYQSVDTSQFDDEERKYLDALNISNGTVYALDLNTMQSSTVVKDIGMNIYFLYASDERVLFEGWQYHPKGMELSGGDKNIVIGYRSGEAPKVWYNVTAGYTIEE